MKNRFTVRKLAQTAVLLALCLAFQLLKSISVYLTGPMVNAILIIASLSCGWESGVAIAILSPLAAYLIGATPIVNLVPAMLPVIAVGNVIISLCAYFFRNKLLPLGLCLGSVLKAGFLWLVTWYIILPFFGSKVPEAMQATVRTTFSITQLITAAIGSVIAYAIFRAVGHFLKGRQTAPDIKE